MKHKSKTTQKIVSEWVSIIGDNIGVDLKLNTDDNHNSVAKIMCEDNINITIETNDENGIIYLHSQIVSLPDGAEKREKYYRTALELNAFSISLGGSSISIDPISDVIILTYMVKVKSINLEIFANLLNDFIRLTFDVIGSNMFEFENKRG